MMKKGGFSLLLLLPFALVGMLMSGCSNDNASGPGEDIAPPPGVTNEQEALKYYALTSSYVADDGDGLSDDVPELAAASGSSPSASSAIIPLGWARFIDNVTKTAAVSIAAGDSVATVTVTKTLTGTFKIQAKYSADDTAIVIIEKPFADQSVRNVMFKRVGRDNTKFWLNWEAMATSLVNGTTMNPPADQVHNLIELTLTKPDGDVRTITDPMGYYLRFAGRIVSPMPIPSPLPVPSPVVFDKSVNEVPELSANQTFTARATIVSNSPDAEVAFLKYGSSPDQHRRVPMTLISQTEVQTATAATITRVYEATAEIKDLPGLFQAGVLTFSNKTLYDSDAANYSVNWWAIPYRVR